MENLENENIAEGISFIVPTFNEEKYIERCLRAIVDEIALSDAPCEIIVVDNLSQDKTLEIASKFDVSIYKCDSQGNPSSTRNLGAKKSKYSILSFVDGDCLITKNWISRLINHYKAHHNGAYGGPVLSPADGNWIERSWAPTVVQSYTLKNVSLAGGNFSICRSLFFELNGFDESLITAEDDDLSKKVISKNYLVTNDSNHPVIHLGYPKTFLEIYKKQIWHGTSQLKAHGIFGDKVVLLTIAWIVCATLLFASVFFLKIEPILFFLFCLLLAPLFIAFKRYKKFKNRSIFSFIKMYLICWPFLAGRVVGLINEIARNRKK